MRKRLLVSVIVLSAALVFMSLAAYAQDTTGPVQVEQGRYATLPDTPPIPEDNPMTPEKVELGRMLFFDPRLSSSGFISCHSCHNLSLGGTDQLPTAIGHDFLTGGRNAPTVLNAAFFELQFWDGRATGLEAQAEGPIQSDVEMAMPADLAVSTIAGIEGYLPYFEAAFPGEADPITFANIVKAIASFERTLITPNDALDRYLRGEVDALSEEAQRGMDVFEQVGCTACHDGPMLSNGRLLRFAHGGEDTGRMRVTGNEADRNVFRVPTLRNITITGPYFHDGSVTTLEEAVLIMGERQLERTELDDEEEIAYIIAFLESLVGDLPVVEIPRLPIN